MSVNDPELVITEPTFVLNPGLKAVKYPRSTLENDLNLPSRQFKYGDRASSCLSRLRILSLLNVLIKGINHSEGISEVERFFTSSSLTYVKLTAISEYPITVCKILMYLVFSNTAIAPVCRNEHRVCPGAIKSGC